MLVSIRLVTRTTVDMTILGEVETPTEIWTRFGRLDFITKQLFTTLAPIGSRSTVHIWGVS